MEIRDPVLSSRVSAGFRPSFPPGVSPVRCHAPSRAGVFVKCSFNSIIKFVAFFNHNQAVTNSPPSQYPIPSFSPSLPRIPRQASVPSTAASSRSATPMGALSPPPPSPRRSRSVAAAPRAGRRSRTRRAPQAAPPPRRPTRGASPSTGGTRGRPPRTPALRATARRCSWR